VSTPRVTVGIPTYNRAAGLERTLGSVRAQTFADLEILISDNASTDATPQVCAQAAAADQRVRVLRHEANAGLTANFNAVLGAARGEYVMVVADDDWLDPDYVERCAALLDAGPGHALVCGGAVYHRGEEERGRGADVSCEQDDAEARLRWWFAHVRDNSAIYGLVRREALHAALPMQNTLAGDWLLIGRILMAGKLRTLPGTHVHRSVGGTSADYAKTAQSMGLSEREVRRPHLAIAHLVREDVAHGGAVYAALGARRERVARACGRAVLRARPLDVAAEIAGPVLRLPGLRRIEPAARGAARRLRGERPYLP
jgi:hypothetical protein